MSGHVSHLCPTFPMPVHDGSHRAVSDISCWSYAHWKMWPSPCSIPPRLLVHHCKAFKVQSNLMQTCSWPWSHLWYLCTHATTYQGILINIYMFALHVKCHCCYLHSTCKRMKAVISSLSINTYLVANLTVSEYTTLLDLLNFPPVQCTYRVKLGRCTRDHMNRCEKSESRVCSRLNNMRSAQCLKLYGKSSSLPISQK